MESIKTTLVPMLSVKNGTAAIDFYKNALGALELGRVGGPDGGVIVAEMSIGGATFFLADESPGTRNFSPETHGGTTVRLELTVPDPDALVEQAVAYGATIMFPVTDHDYGFRQGRIVDPFGHQWVIGRPL